MVSGSAIVLIDRAPDCENSKEPHPVCLIGRFPLVFSVFEHLLRADSCL